MNRLIALLLIACASAQTASSAPRLASVQSGPPNVLVMVADDLGPTEMLLLPSVADLAVVGMTFERAYASCPTCSASRLGMLSGAYARREGIGDLSLNPLSTLPQDRLRLTLTLLPEVLPGYGCALFGKWHMGRAPLDNASDLGLTGFELARAQAPIAPLTQGFEFWRAGSPCVPLCGSMSTGYYKWWRVDHGLAQLSTTYATDAQRDSFIDWWTTTTGPKFAWLAWSAPHEPYQAPPGMTTQATPRANYEQLVAYLDGAIADVLSTVDLADTLIIFTADNGTPDDARPLGTPSGVWKGSTFEGGVHVPLVVAGPGVLPGASASRVVSLVDLPATVAEVAGVPGTFPDSVSFADALGPTWTGAPARAFAFAERYEVAGPGPTIPQPAGYDDQAVIEGDTFWPGTAILVRMKLRRVNTVDLAYDLLSDPFELDPVPLGDPMVHPAVRARFLAELASLPVRAP